MEPPYLEEFLMARYLSRALISIFIHVHFASIDLQFLNCTTYNLIKCHVCLIIVYVVTADNDFYVLHTFSEIVTWQLHCILHWFSTEIMRTSTFTDLNARWQSPTLLGYLLQTEKQQLTDNPPTNDQLSNWLTDSFNIVVEDRHTHIMNDNF